MGLIELTKLKNDAREDTFESLAMVWVEFTYIHMRNRMYAILSVSSVWSCCLPYLRQLCSRLGIVFFPTQLSAGLYNFTCAWSPLRALLCATSMTHAIVRLHFGAFREESPALPHMQWRRSQVLIASWKLSDSN